MFMTRICSCSGSLTSMLEISRKGKQLTKAYCGTCGGRPLVDGIEPESASMLSAVDLELTDFIKSGLTWKKVKKGCRSTTRRRKSITQSVKAGAELGKKSCKRDQDSSVSDSEKLGVAVLGRRFAEKVVDVPIKKRRFSFRSPSPPPRTPSPDHEGSLSPQPQTPSPHPEELEQFVDSTHAVTEKQCSEGLDSNCKKWPLDKSVGLKFVDNSDGVRNSNKSEVTDGGYDYDDDFSGIELLAAAACSGSIDIDVTTQENCSGDAFVKAEVIDSPNAAIPFKESIASSGTGHSSDKEVNEDDIGESFVERSTVAMSVGLKKDNDGMVKNRAHWDLNTVMEAWEEPYDDPLVNPQSNPKPVPEDSMLCEMQENMKDSQCDIERGVQPLVYEKVLSDAGGNQNFIDSNTVVVATVRTCKDEGLKVCSSPVAERTSIEKQRDVTTTEGVQEPLNNDVSDAFASICERTVDASSSNSCPSSQRAARLHVLEFNVNESANVIEQMGKVSSGTSVAQNRNFLFGSHQINKLDNLSPNLLLLNKSSFEVNDTQGKDGENFEKTYESPDGKASLGQMKTSLACTTLDVTNSIGEASKVDQYHPSPKGEALSASSTSAVIGEVKLQVDKAYLSDNTFNNFALQIPIDRTINSTNLEGKLDLEKHSTDCIGSYATRDDHVGDTEHVTEYENGYDSSVEDGELREPGVYSWEEDELQGEPEYEDYGSDYGDGDDFGAVNCSISENLVNGRSGYQISKKGTSFVKNDKLEMISAVGNRPALDGGSFKSLEQSFEGDALEGRNLSVSLKAKSSGGDRFKEHWERGIAEGNVDEHNDKGLLVGEFGLRASRGKLSSFDPLERKDTFPLQRSRYDNSSYSYSRSERNFGSEKSLARNRFSFKGCGRNEADGPWVDSSAGYRESRNRYPHGYRGPENNGYSRPRDSITNSGAKVGGLNCNDDGRAINYTSNGMYRPFTRRRSPSDRDDSYGGQRGLPPLRGISQDRSRGRSRQYVQGIRRGPKEDYPEDVPDAAAVHSVRRQPYFARRERGFSPTYRSGHFSRSRRDSSCSRSRTRSPVPWHLQRDRNAGTRRHSPDFRSDARMERARSPFQKATFAAGNEESFMSPPRGQLSPESNSRWFNDSNYIDSHFRDRRSPVRVFRRSQRFDSFGSSGRKLDGFSRSMTRSGRFHQMSGRGRDFEGGDDEQSKHDDGYEMSHRVRRYDAGGAVRRFHYDAEDCFESRNSQSDDCFRRDIKRDLSRNGAREDRSLRYNSGRMYPTVSSAIQRDYNENAATRENDHQN